MIDRADLPLRDLLRFALPGVLAASYLEAGFYAWTGEFMTEEPSTPVFILVALLGGLLSFSIGFHKHVPPWKKQWHQFVGDIRRELALATDTKEVEEPYAKAAYKIWLEGMEGQDRLKSHLLYQTGIFYSFAAMSVWSGIFFLSTLPAAIYSAMVLIDACGKDLAGSDTFRFVSLLVGFVLTWVFGAQAIGTLRDLSKETLATLKLTDVQAKVRELVSQIMPNDAS